MYKIVFSGLTGVLLTLLLYFGVFESNPLIKYLLGTCEELGCVVYFYILLFSFFIIQISVYILNIFFILKIRNRQFLIVIGLLLLSILLSVLYLINFINSEMTVLLFGLLIINCLYLVVSPLLLHLSKSDKLLFVLNFLLIIIMPYIIVASITH